MGNNHTSAHKDFSPDQFKALRKFFKDIAKRKNLDYLDKDLFLRVFNLPGMLGERLFDVFDANKDAKVDLGEYLNGLAVIIHGSKERKIKFLFEMYDLNQDGFVCREDLNTMLSCAMNGALTFLAEMGEEAPQSEADDSPKYDEFEAYVSKLVDSAFCLNGKRLDQPLDFADFNKFVRENEQLLQLLEDAFIFEDFTSEEENHAGRGGAGKQSQREVNGVELSHKKMRRILDTHCSKGSCALGMIITPDSVKERHKKNAQNGACHHKSLRSQGAVPINVWHAFEHMHHFHHNANHSGEMYKVTNKLKLLQKRYFVLHDSFLYIFNRRESIQPIQTIWMKGCAVESKSYAHRSKKKSWGIEISSPCDSKNLYTKMFYALTKEEQHKWLNALSLASESKSFHKLFQVTREIGTGRFSRVCVCVRKSNGAEYAVKIIDKSKIGPRENESLRLEISILKLLHHPNVTQMRDFFEEKETAYILMGLYKGGDLYEKIKREGRLSERKARPIMWSIFDAVRYIHRLGIMHRDLKPENILLRGGGDERVAVGDFGLSDFLGPESVLKVPCGTLAYVAPEVFVGQGYSKEIDLWSLGVVLHALLKGSLPFGGGNKTDTVNHILTRSLDLEGSGWDSISREAKDLVDGLLKVDPRRRTTIEEAMKHPWFYSK